MSTNSKVMYCTDGIVSRSCSTFVNVSHGVMPPKAPDGVGYEVDLIGRTDGRVDDVLNEVNEFHTGIILNAPTGFHYEVYGTPELWKSGYFLPSGMLVVPSDEELIVPLVKFTDKITDLECGNFRGVCVILRENVYANIIVEKIQPPSQPYYQLPVQVPGGYFVPQMQTQQSQQVDRNVRAPINKGRGNVLM